MEIIAIASSRKSNDECHIFLLLSLIIVGVKHQLHEANERIAISRGIQITMLIRMIAIRYENKQEHFPT